MDDNLDIETIATTEERRRTSRANCCYQVECRQGERRFQASVINMGLGGMRFLSTHRLPAEHCLVVVQTGTALGNVEVRVVWSQEQGNSQTYETGVVYLGPIERLDDSWVKPALRNLGFEGPARYERRRYRRAPANARGRLNWQGQEYACQVLDLGFGGALIQTDSPIPLAQPGSQVRLQVEVQNTEPLPAHIVYLRSPQDEHRQYGLCFDTDRLTQAQARLVEGYLQAIR